MLICMAGWSANAPAVIERRAWLFEQLGAPPLPTRALATRYQLTIDEAHYQDLISSQLSAVLDLRYFEIRLKASRRTSAGLGNESAALDTLLAEDRTVIGAEIGRYYISPNHHFGRLALEVLQAYPAGAHWVRLGLQTGILPSAGSPWGLRLNTQFFGSLSSRSSYILINAEIDREITSSFTAGGHFGWTDRTTNDPGGVARWEYLSFALGPLVKWETSWATIQFEATAKWWIDHERLPTANVEVQSPSDIQPALALHVWVPL